MNTIGTSLVSLNRAPVNYTGAFYSKYSAEGEFSAKRNLYEVRKQLSEDRQNRLKKELEAQKTFTAKSAESEFNKNYADALRAQRNKSKNTSLNKKKLKYRFKSISSKIISSKTSAAARQVVSVAKREVIRLKKEKQKGGYDSEEMEAAIAHAKAMEIVARKKLKHLEQEELAKAANGIFENNPVLTRQNAEEDVEETVNGEEMLSEEEALHTDDLVAEDEYEDLEDITASGLSDEVFNAKLEELAEETAELEEDLLSELGIDELTEEFLDVSDMDAEDLKELKLKHRTKELKEMAEADSKYLKALFDQMARMKAAGAAAVSISMDPAGGNSTTFAAGAMAFATGAQTAAAVGTETAEASVIDVCV